MPNQYGIVENVACICETCGKVTQRYPSQIARFCSLACKGAASRTRIERECPICRAKFTIPPSRLHHRAGTYCSKACAIASSKTGRELPCQQCGSRFYASAWDIANRAAYCSAHCMHAARRDRIDRTCPNCDKSFTSTPWKVANGEGRYCSRKCAAAGKTKTDNVIIRQCANCRSPFSVSKPQAARGNGQYCSKSCAALAQPRSPFQQRRGNSAYRTWRNAVFARDEHACQRCGSTDELRAHHILGWMMHPSLRFDIANGLTLCKPCHERHHAIHGPFRKRRCAS